MPSRQRKKRAKRREYYLKTRDHILKQGSSEESRARARARYGENPEKKRAAQRKRYHDKKKRASEVQLYHDNPEPKLTAKREHCRENPEDRGEDVCVGVCVNASVNVCA